MLQTPLALHLQFQLVLEPQKGVRSVGNLLGDFTALLVQRAWSAIWASFVADVSASLSFFL